MLEKTNNENIPFIIYNTQTISKQEINNNFVLRKELYNLIWDDLNSFKINFKDQHFLIQGVRGSGKTFFLMKLFYDIQDSNKLKNSIPILLKEEEYFISCLGNLWILICEELKYRDSIFDDLFIKMNILFKNQVKNEEKKLFKILEKTLKKYNKKIILLIDNIGDIFNIIGEKHTKIFKQILSSSNIIRIIATNNVVPGTNSDYEKLFLTFFKKIHLKELDLKEIKKLILYCANISKNEQINIIVEKHQGKIEALTRLTGRSLRTIILLFEIFSKTKNITTYNYLEKIIDGTTPLYKPIMDNTIPSQKPIIDIIARNWDGITAKKISKKTRQKTSLVSAHLAKLEKNNIVLKQKTSTKNNIYFLKERFFNIWYLLRLGRNKEREKVMWLTRFLELWCSQKKILDKTEIFKTSLKSKNFTLKNAVFFDLPILFIDNLMEKEDLHFAIKNYLEKIESKKNLKELSNVEIREVFEKISRDVKNKSDDKLTGFELFLKANIFHVNKDYEDSERYYKKAIKKGHIGALNSLGFLYKNSYFNKYDKAEKYYKQGINKGNISALYNLAIFYFQQNIKKNQAMELILKAIKNNNTNFDYLFAYVFMLIWHNKVKQALLIIKKILKNKEFFKKYEQECIEILIFLISKNQLNIALELINSFNLEKKLKPVYYALMILMKDQYKDEYLKMGPELKTTVNEILENIHVLRKKYSVKL
ncbi:MAG: hypothetical protein B6I26_06600 [Desulfobacteraceae bacterium 4572_130]|nr:MAG: hypothetical protein B6I26_06600 [Desulfobacteraceae bacterium 4572_130]